MSSDKPKGFFSRILGAVGNMGTTPNLPGLLVAYSVSYKGGHPKYPEPKKGFIDFNVFGDRFEVTPPPASPTEKWFKGLTIQYEWVLAVEIVERKVGTTEAILSKHNYQLHKQKNTIVITYKSPKAKEEILLRLEMLSGVHVMAQADKCQEFMTMLKDNNILAKFPRQKRPVAKPVEAHEDIPAQIEKLAALRDKGIVTEEEFAKKKSELLSRM